MATVFSVLAFASVAAAQSATLAWNANTEPDLAGYRVEFGTVSGNPSTTVDVGNVTQRQFTGLQAGVTYYFRVKAYNTSGDESTPSAEVSHTPPVAVVPTLTSISPTSGPSAGGTTITLAGTNFASGATVRVNGVAATGVTFVSATQVRATTPAGSAGARTVQITNPSGQSASLAGAFTYVGGPGLTSVSPTSGPTAGGTTITITGSGFVSGATVRVNGVVGDRRHVPVRDAGARGDAGRHRGCTERAGHEPRRPVGHPGQRVHLHDLDADADADGRVAVVGSDRRRHRGDAHRHQLRGRRDGDDRRHRGDQRRRRERHLDYGADAGRDRRRA